MQRIIGPGIAGVPLFDGSVPSLMFCGPPGGGPSHIIGQPQCRRIALEAESRTSLHPRRP
jgi:hypothetical protein